MQVLLAVLTRLLQVEHESEHLVSCTASICRVIRAWNEYFPKNARGQLWPVICRFGRVVPEHYCASMFALASCGDLWPSLLKLPPNFHMQLGAEKSWLAPKSCPVANAFAEDDDKPPSFDDFLGEGLAADSIRASLKLVRRVNAPTERLYFSDFQEFIGQCLMASVTSNALLHVLAARNLVMLSELNFTAVKSLVNIGVEAMRKVSREEKGRRDQWEQEDASRLATLGRVLLLLDRMVRISSEVGRQVLDEHDVADIFIARLLSVPNSSPLQEMANDIIRRTISMLTYIIERVPASVSLYRSIAKTLSTHILDGKKERADMTPGALNLLKAMSSQNSSEQLIYNHKRQIDPAFRLDKFAARAIQEKLALPELTALCAMLRRNVPDVVALGEIISSAHMEALGVASTIPLAAPSPPIPDTPRVTDVAEFVKQVFHDAKQLENSWTLFSKLEETKRVDEWLFNRQVLRRKRREARDKLSEDLGEKKRRRLNEKKEEARETLRRKMAQAPSKHVDATDDIVRTMPKQAPPPGPFFNVPIFQNQPMLMGPPMFPMTMAMPMPMVAVPMPWEGPEDTNRIVEPVPTTPEPAPMSEADVKQTNSAMQKFVADHPEYMRVLKDPVKTLADPRVKEHLQTHLQEYPLVKAFLSQRGVRL